MSQTENPTPPPAPADAVQPEIEFATVPLWLIVVFGALCYWCQLYLDDNAGGFNKKVYAPFDSLAQVQDAQPKSETGKLIAQGKAVFEQSCMLCHMQNGLGQEGKFPPLAASDWIVAPSPARIGRIVLDGITGPVTVSGKLFDVGGAVMVAWRTVYSDAQIAAALSYVRQQWGNNAPPIKPEQITAIRDETKSHANHPWTAEELLQVPLQ